MDWGGVLFSKAAFFLGLSVWGLFMTGNCSRTWFVTTSCRYSNPSLAPLKIDPLHPWEEKSKKIKVGGGPVRSAAGPQTDFKVQRCSSWGLLNRPPKSRKGRGGCQVHPTGILQAPGTLASPLLSPHLSSPLQAELVDYLA